MEGGGRRWGGGVSPFFVLSRNPIDIFWQFSNMRYGLLFANNVCLENL